MKQRQAENKTEDVTKPCSYLHFSHKIHTHIFHWFSFKLLLTCSFLLCRSHRCLMSLVFVLHFRFVWPFLFVNVIFTSHFQVSQCLPSIWFWTAFTAATLAAVESFVSRSYSPYHLLIDPSAANLPMNVTKKCSFYYRKWKEPSPCLRPNLNFLT